MITEIIKKEIKRYKYVSFDVFDTLIEREYYYPPDVFLKTGECILGKEKSKEYQNRRISAEEKARKKRSNGEVTLEDIFCEVAEIYGERVSNRLKEKELDIEYECCRPRKQGVKLFNYAVQNRCRVVLISDMYLSGKTISKLLMKCGISGYEKLFVSCECGCNKVHGELFDWVLNDLMINPRQILHIGDSIKRDIFGAKTAGIKSCIILSKNVLKKRVKGRVTRIRHV